MQIRAGYDIAFQCFQETPMILMLSIEPAREKELLSEHQIQFSPDIPSRNYIDMFGNTCTRIVAPAGLIEMRNDFLISDSGLPDDVAPVRLRRLFGRVGRGRGEPLAGRSIVEPLRETLLRLPSVLRFRDVRIARLQDRGMTTEDAERRMAAQASDEERRSIALSLNPSSSKRPNV